jgi:biotin carboxyl carrier protein
MIAAGSRSHRHEILALRTACCARGCKFDAEALACLCIVCLWPKIHPPAKRAVVDARALTLSFLQSHRIGWLLTHSSIVNRPGRSNRRTAGLPCTPERNCSLYKLPVGVKDGNHSAGICSLTLQEAFSIKHHSFGKPPAAFSRETHREESKAMSKQIKAPMPGKVVDILVKVGEEVLEYQEVLILEAMKMENAIPSPESGKVKEINVKKDDTVASQQVLMVLE